MAPTTLLVIALALAISLQGSIGNEIECENLDEHSCAYAVSSMGKRCVLEKLVLRSEYTCRTSEIMADMLTSGLIETNECVDACNLNRKELGISSDSLLDRDFVESLCSDKCYHNCPNIVDLFFNLAAGEGVYLPNICETKKSNGHRREMLDLNSGGGIPEAASGPTAANALAASPAP